MLLILGLTPTSSPPVCMCVCVCVCVCVHTCTCVCVCVCVCVRGQNASPTLEHFGIHLWVLWNQLGDERAAGRVVCLSDAEQQLILSGDKIFYNDRLLWWWMKIGTCPTCSVYSGSLNGASIHYTVQLDHDKVCLHCAGPFFTQTHAMHVQGDSK